MTSNQLRLFDVPLEPAPSKPSPRERPPEAPEPRGLDADRAARAAAVDPRRNVVLEASAGTGKTSILVRRYLNLIEAGVDPANILAITFTRKAAAEMRERIIAGLRRASTESEAGRKVWRELRDRLREVGISTIDAFCFALLREFPLEAGLDPGFRVADETEVARFVEDSLDRSLRLCRALARDDADVGLVFARFTAARLRAGMAHLLDRRLVVPSALSRYLQHAPMDLTAASACLAAAERLRVVLNGASGGLHQFLADGPLATPRFSLLAGELRALGRGTFTDAAAFSATADEIRAYFITQEGRPRVRPHGFRASEAGSDAAWKRHVASVEALAPRVREALEAWDRDVNLVLARGVRRMFAITRAEYARTLAEHNAVDFPELVERASDLLRQMDEFSRSRYRLESRYHHVLVDEFQDTSRIQWQLVALLVTSWGEGLGLVHDAPLLPSLFVVGDRKQSIYRFRDADAGVLDDAAREIAGLRPTEGADGAHEAGVRHAISRSFRSVPAILSFVNDVCGALVDSTPRRGGFEYGDADRFPVEPTPADTAEPALGIVAADRPEECASRVAGEIARLIGRATVRDRETGVARPVRPGDVAVLFRSRESHRAFAEALDAHGVPAYVYKGLGFFDADEVKDLLALIRFLAAPASDLRAAAFARSRLVRLSDSALLRLGPELAAAFTGAERPAFDTLDDEDRRVLTRARASVRNWIDLVDRLPPAELLDHVLAVAAYQAELTGARSAQARENVKKLRSLIRRIQNRGYATIGRIADHLDRLSAGDEAHALVDTFDAVSLMTVHAAKGLEFPIVFLVNVSRGVARRRQPIRATLSPVGDRASVSIDAFQSEADELEPVLEREETKRLLYVALTRARDRLYLSATLKDGACRPASGSLASVLPPTLLALFSDAGSQGAWHRLSWPGRSAQHQLSVVGPADAQSRLPDAAEGARTAVQPVADRPPALSPLWPRMPATLSSPPSTATFVDVEADTPAKSDLDASSDDTARRLVGRLVYRLFEQGVTPADPEELARRATSLIRRGEGTGTSDPARIGVQAAAVFVKLASRPELQELLGAGRGGIVYREVPFSLRIDREGAGSGVVVRGTIDAVAKANESRFVVVEIKTGRRAPEHQDQLATYVEAVRQLWPDSHATGVLVYP